MNEKVTCSECRHFNAETNYCKRSEATVRPGYGCYEGEPRIITNGDRIRQLTDEELAKFITKCVGGCYRCPAKKICEDDHFPCSETVRVWLERNAEDE